MDAAPSTNRRVVMAIVACLLLAFLPTRGAAQEPVTSFDQLNTRLKVGDTVWVTDAQGREIKGQIRELGPSALTLDSADTRPLEADAVRLVAQRQGRPIGKGALYGLIVGAAAGVVLGATGVTDCESCSNWSSGKNALTTGLALGAVGAGLGAVIGAASPGKEVVVYRARGVSGGARLSLTPVLTLGTKGVAVSFSF
jgi:hypothetical protein